MDYFTELDEILDGAEEPDDSTEGQEVADCIAEVVAGLAAIKAVTDTLPRGDYA